MLVCSKHKTQIMPMSKLVKWRLKQVIIKMSKVNPMFSQFELFQFGNTLHEAELVRRSYASLSQDSSASSTSSMHDGASDDSSPQSFYPVWSSEDDSSNGSSGNVSPKFPSQDDSCTESSVGRTGSTTSNLNPYSKPFIPSYLRKRSSSSFSSQSTNNFFDFCLQYANNEESIHPVILNIIDILCSNLLSTEWKSVAKSLGIDDNILKNPDYAEYDNEKEQMKAIFCLWAKFNESLAIKSQCSQIKKALSLIVRYDIINKINVLIFNLNSEFPVI